MGTLMGNVTGDCVHRYSLLQHYVSIPDYDYVFRLKDEMENLLYWVSGL